MIDDFDDYCVYTYVIVDDICQMQEFREEGYPIGSGTVESGVKQFESRLTGAGMRWSRPAAQQMLVIRAAVLASSFDTYWDAISVPLHMKCTPF